MALSSYLCPLLSIASVPTHFNLKTVSKETLRIDRVATCAHEHFCCSFGAEYFGMVNLAIVSVLQGYTTQAALNRWAEGSPLHALPAAFQQESKSNEKNHRVREDLDAWATDCDEALPIGRGMSEGVGA